LFGSSLSSWVNTKPLPWFPRRSIVRSNERRFRDEKPHPMKVSHLLLLLATLALSSPQNHAQALIAGRLLGERSPGSSELFPFTAILAFDSLAGPGREPCSFRTWETEPVGWFRFDTDAGNHTLLFTGPNHFLRPIVLNNIFMRSGEKLENVRPTPNLEFANFSDREWDPKPARAYFQTFVARGKSLTHVGFRLATDGVDGFGPLAQNLLASVHRQGPGTPDTWPQVGPTAIVPDVDCGGAKNYIWCAGWNSGEVPLVPGISYAVQIRAQREGGTFQAFWRQDFDKTTDCYRLGPDGQGAFVGRKIWLGLGSDADRLLIPYNKRVHKQYGQFAGFASRWAQSYTAQGRSLASVVLYAAVGGAQPPLSRQRVLVRVRHGGPAGPLCGIEKIAIGNGNYTGDASWGAFGAAFAPGEVPLTPGEAYSVEFESLENFETLHGYVNIKGMASDDRAGFNPYRKFAPDDYPLGTAFKSGVEEMPFDLDMQIIEYECAATNWAFACTGTNLLANGSMEQFTPDASGKEPSAPPRGVSGYNPSGRIVALKPDAWDTFAIDASTRFAVLADAESTNHFARIFAAPGQTADGGLVQCASGLDKQQTYRLTARLRASWAVDLEHQSLLGLDPTGQTTDPKAPSILWQTAPPRHGIWIDFTSDPVRPATNSISIWLRARSTAKSESYAPFKADFDDLAVHQVQISPP
jgi:hypothetical protein